MSGAKRDSGGGGGVPLAEAFVDSAGKIKWRALATAVFGSTILAWFTGIAEFALTVASSATRVIDGVSSFGAELVRAIFGTPQALFATSWGNLDTFVSGAGPAGFVLAVGAVLVVAYTFSWGVNRIVQ